MKSLNPATNLQELQSREEPAQGHHVDAMLKKPGCEKYYNTNNSAS